MNTAARRRLPNRRFSETFSLESHGMRFTATISRFDDGGLAGSQADANACDAAVVCSRALQHGVPLETVHRALMRDGSGHPRTALGVALDHIAKDGAQ